MTEPVAWWQNSDFGGYTIWYQNPYENGLPEGTKVIPLYEGWEKEREEFESTLDDGYGSKLNEEGKWYPVWVGITSNDDTIEPPKTEINILADTIRSGINSI